MSCTQIDKVATERFLHSFEPGLSLEDVVIWFRELNIVTITGWPFFDHALYMLGTYPNVYMETSVAIRVLGPDLFHRLLKEAVAAAGRDLVLFGTLQMAWPELIDRSVNMIRDADFIKPYVNLSREVCFAIMNQARYRGIPVDGHIPFRITPEEAAGAGQRTVEHPKALPASCLPNALKTGGEQSATNTNSNGASSSCSKRIRNG